MFFERGVLHKVELFLKFEFKKRKKRKDWWPVGRKK